jgi:hypothetical protein
MANGSDDDVFMNIGCISLIVLGIIATIVTAWEKAPGLVILIIILTIAIVGGRIFYMRNERIKINQRLNEGLDNYQSYGAMMFEEELRSKRIENDLKESQLEFAYADRDEAFRAKEVDESYHSLLFEEELRAKRLENDLKQSQVDLAFLERQNKQADRNDASLMKAIEREMKSEELNLMRIKSEYESIKNKIRDLKDGREI